jgi:hypothetical protein
VAIGGDLVYGIALKGLSVGTVITFGGTEIFGRAPRIIISSVCPADSQYVQIQ